MRPDQIELLLIEDNMFEAELALRHLSKYVNKNAVLHIDNGEEAIDLLFARGKYEHTQANRVKPRLILLDLKLPKMSGIDILKHIKENDATRSIPVVMLTSSSELADIEACYEKGANSYVVKPVGFDDFSKTMESMEAYWLSLNKLHY